MVDITMRRVFRVLYCLVAAATLAGLPVLIIDFKNHDWSVHYKAFFVATIFVLLSVPVSLYEIAMHLENFSRPKLQTRIIRILFMVPIYALDSLLTLRFIDARLYLDPIRECYEAFVIYNFYMFLIAYLEDEYGDVTAYFSTKADVRHIWGVQYVMPTWPMGEEFFWQCKKGVLSYVILRPLMTLVATLAMLLGTYNDGSLSYDSLYTYVSIINATSQMWALYCLVLMYQACKAELAPIRPLAKFLCIKGVIFFTYWQSVGIAILQSMGLIKANESWTTYDADDVVAGLQEFLICIEMFVAALAHAYAFPPSDYTDPLHPPQGMVRNMRKLFDVTDVVDDVQGVVDETVQRTTDNLHQATTTSWRTAKRTSANVVAGPMNLLRYFSPRSGGSQQPQQSWEASAGNRHGTLPTQQQHSALAARVQTYQADVEAAERSAHLAQQQVDDDTASDQTNSPASPMAKGTAKGAAGGGASAAAAAADAGKNASAIQGLSQQALELLQPTAPHEQPAMVSEDAPSLHQPAQPSQQPQQEGPQHAPEPLRAVAEPALQQAPDAGAAASDGPGVSGSPFDDGIMCGQALPMTNSEPRSTPKEGHATQQDVSQSHAAHEASCDVAEDQAAGNKKQARSAKRNTINELAQETPDGGAEMDAAKRKGAGGAAARRQSKQSRRNSEHDAAEEPTEEDAELQEATVVKAAMTFQRRKAQRQQPSHHQADPMEMPSDDDESASEKSGSEFEEPAPSRSKAKRKPAAKGRQARAPAAAANKRGGRGTGRGRGRAGAAAKPAPNRPAAGRGRGGPEAKQQKQTTAREDAVADKENSLPAERHKGGPAAGRAAAAKITPAKRKGLAARQPDKRAAASEQDTTDDGGAHGTAQARATDRQADSDSADEELPVAASSPDGGLTFRTACRSGQKSQPTPNLAGCKKQYQREQQCHAQTRKMQPKQPSHRLVDKEHRAAQQLTPAEEYDMNLGELQEEEDNSNDEDAPYQQEDAPALQPLRLAHKVHRTQDDLERELRMALHDGSPPPAEEPAMAAELEAGDEPASPGGFEMADDDEDPGCLTLNPGGFHMADESEDQGLDLLSDRDDVHRAMPTSPLEPRHLSMLEGDPLPPTAGIVKTKAPRHGHQQRAGGNGAGGMARNMLSPMRTPEHGSWLQPKGALLDSAMEMAGRGRAAVERKHTAAAAAATTAADGALSSVKKGVTGNRRTRNKAAKPVSPVGAAAPENDHVEPAVVRMPAHSLSATKRGRGAQQESQDSEVGGPNPEALATIAQVVAQMSAAAERSARAKRHKIAKEAEAAADAEVTKTEAAIRRIQEAASKHIAAQHEQLRQEQQATVDAAEEATRAYQAQIAQLHQEYQARHAQRGPAIAQDAAETEFKVSATIKRKLEGMHASVADIIQEAQRRIKRVRVPDVNRSLIQMLQGSGGMAGGAE